MKSGNVKIGGELKVPCPLGGAGSLSGWGSGLIQASPWVILKTILRVLSRWSAPAVEHGKLKMWTRIQARASFELAHEFNEHWLMSAAYTYFNETPDLSFREADKLASLIINYQQGHWSANLVVTYLGERDMPTGGSISNRITLDDYWQLFGKLRYNFTSDWQAYVQVKNLLDEAYLTPASSTALTEGIPNRGREILAGIKWRF